MLANIVAAGISALVVIVGWIIAHNLNLKRDALQKRRDLRVQYLLDAYRKLENSSGRSGEELASCYRVFESAVADVQLLGTRTQIEKLLPFLRQFEANTGANINTLLDLLRDDLRRELDLESEVPQIHQFRFKVLQAPQHTEPG